jgi:hypothetical protein
MCCSWGLQRYRSERTGRAQRDLTASKALPRRSSTSGGLQGNVTSGSRAPGGRLDEGHFRSAVGEQVLGRRAGARSLSAFMAAQ